MERTDGKATKLRNSGEQKHTLKKKTLTLEKPSESESDSDVWSLCSLDTRDDSRSRHEEAVVYKTGAGVQSYWTVENSTRQSCDSTRPSSLYKVDARLSSTRTKTLAIQLLKFSQLENEV